MSFVRCKRRVLSIISFFMISILMTAVVYLNPVRINATTVEELQQSIADLESDQAAIEAEIKKLKDDKADKNAIKVAIQKKADNLQNQINACNKKIDAYDSEITELEREISEKNKELDNTKYIFQQRLRAICMSGGTSASSLTLLLNADSLSDMLAKAELTKNISAYDNSLMEKIVSDVSAINDKQQKLSSLIAEQNELKQSLVAKKNEYNSQISDLNGDISAINSDQSTLEAQAKRLEAAIAEYETEIRSKTDVGSDRYTDGQFLWPMANYYYISSPYGYRVNPVSGKYKLHAGIDIAGSGINGKPILASADGVVSVAKYNDGGYGYYVMINHGTGSDGNLYSTLYGHMTRYIVSVGQNVTKGQVIGYVGSTGASTGPHLHFEIRINGVPTNPLKFF